MATPVKAGKKRLHLGTLLLSLLPPTANAFPPPQPSFCSPLACLEHFHFDRVFRFPPHQYQTYAGLLPSVWKCARPLCSRLRVDFTKAEETRYPQQYQPSPLPVHYELLTDGYTRHQNLDADLRVQDRTPPHLLYSDLDWTFLEGEWTSLSKSSDRRNSLEGYSRSVRSRSGERWGGDGDRSINKPFKERKILSLTLQQSNAKCQ
ncbi:hypothetical protein ACRRTK_021434 [Alexandromys fortis]